LNKNNRPSEFRTVGFAFYLFFISRCHSYALTQLVIGYTNGCGFLWEEAGGGHTRKGVGFKTPEYTVAVHNEIKSRISRKAQSREGKASCL